MNADVIKDGIGRAWRINSDGTYDLAGPAVDGTRRGWTLEAVRLRFGSQDPEPVAATLSVRVHKIADDGYPDMNNDQLTGRVAFIFDGCVVSGWPLHNDPQNYASGFSGDWEADSDVGRTTRFKGVTHWLEFPVPVWNMEQP